MIRVRTAVKEDYVICRAIEQYCYGCVLDIVDALISASIEKKHVYIAEEDRETLGYACISYWDDVSMHIFSIEALWGTKRIPAIEALLRSIEKDLNLRQTEIRSLLIQASVQDLVLLESLVKSGFSYRATVGTTYLLEKSI